MTANKRHLILSEELQRDRVQVDFEGWWHAYPRKIGKPQALSAYRLRRKEGASAEELALARDNYLATKDGVEQKFIKHARSFLGPNWSEWLDDLDDGSTVYRHPRND